MNAYPVVLFELLTDQVITAIECVQFGDGRSRAKMITGLNMTTAGP
jgi:hypothetical protein